MSGVAGSGYVCKGGGRRENFFVAGWASVTREFGVGMAYATLEEQPLVTRRADCAGSGSTNVDFLTEKARVSSHNGSHAGHDG